MILSLVGTPECFPKWYMWLKDDTPKASVVKEVGVHVFHSVVYWGVGERFPATVADSREGAAAPLLAQNFFQ